jgi:hypothetical protein
MENASNVHSDISWTVRQVYVQKLVIIARHGNNQTENV